MRLVAVSVVRVASSQTKRSYIYLGEQAKVEMSRRGILGCFRRHKQEMQAGVDLANPIFVDANEINVEASENSLGTPTGGQ